MTGGHTRGIKRKVKALLNSDILLYINMENLPVVVQLSLKYKEINNEGFKS